ncbi:hypothetical protein B0H10DRAFT_1945680 [Mycena sp. CBHHK59/15]|nr:hypothetical protein B0H10DRAFT_1945680 [Mycena sp. CBHHK59/15]
MAVGSDQEKTVSPPNIVAAHSMLYPVSLRKEKAHQSVKSLLAILAHITHLQILQGECNQFTLLWLKALAKFRTVQQWSYGSLMHAYTNFNTADQPFSLGSPISEFRREIANLCNWNWHGPQKSAQTIHPQSDHPSANFSGNLQPVCTIVVESIVQDQDYATVGRELCDVGFHQFLHCRLAILPQITHWQISQRDCEFVQLGLAWPPKFIMRGKASSMHAAPNFNATDHPFLLKSPIGEFHKDIADLCNWGWHGPQISGWVERPPAKMQHCSEGIPI